jgi:hypothetical protein
MSIVSSILNTGDSSSLNRKIQFIGYGNHKENNGLATDFPLSVLDIKFGDLIVFQRCSGSTTSDVGSMATPTGFSLLTSTYASDTFDVTMETYYKIATGGEDLTSFSSMNDTQSSVSVSVMVFRGTDGTAPTVLLDLATNNADDITWPFVGALGSDSVVLYLGSTGHEDGTITYTDPGDLDFFFTRGSGDTNDHAWGIGYKHSKSTPSFAAGDWVLSATTSTFSANASAILIIQ